MNAKNEPEIPHWDWETVYMAALTEPLDSAEIPNRLRVAETAIFRRIQKLVPIADTHGERDALAQAARSLTYVRDAVSAHAAKQKIKPSSGSERTMFREEWYGLYQSAVLETDFAQLLKRIADADEAIVARLSMNGHVSAEERQALLDSRALLVVLKQERTELRGESYGKRTGSC